MRKSLAATLFALVFARGAYAAESPLPFQRFVLKNGLEVLVHEDHTTPVVAVQVLYRVGSKDEEPGKTGFAHLFEHLMFKGSRNVRDGGHFQAIVESGGSCNATTSRDRTTYFEIVPAEALARALFLESDRMWHLLDGVTQKSLDNQRDVVRNERRQNYENKPYGSSVRPFMEALYPQGHPYHWLTIGDHADLEHAELYDVQSFFRRFYRPGNATLAVAGDVDLATARRLVEASFGSIPSNPNVPNKLSPERTQRPAALPIVKLEADQVVSLEDDVSLERLTLGWPSPAAFEPGDAALDLLATILGPTSGRLHRLLVHDLQIAQSVAVGQDSALLGSSFEITITMKPGHSSAEALKVVDEELDKLRSGVHPVEPAELEVARARVEADSYFSLMQLGGRGGGRTERLLYYDYYARDPGFLVQDLARYRAVDGPAIQAALRSLGRYRVRMTVRPKHKVEVAK